MKPNVMILTVAAVIGCALCGCEKEPTSQPAITKGLVLNATSGPLTKTYGQTAIYFSEGDRLSLFDTAGENNVFSQVSPVSGAENTDFTGDISDNSTPTFAVYPYDEASTITEDGTITVTVPASYEASGQDSILEGMNISVGQPVKAGDGYAVSLKNVCGLVGFRIAADVVGVHQVSLTEKSGHALTGTVSFRYNDGTPVVTSVADGASTVTFTVAHDSRNAKALPGYYFFSVVPGTYTGFGIDITLLNGKTVHFDYDHAVTVERNKRILIRDISLEDVQASQPGTLAIELKFSENGNTILYTETNGADKEYLPTKANQKGATYYFDKSSNGTVYSYPFFIGSADDGGNTVSHYFLTSRNALLLAGDSAYIQTPALPGKKLKTVSFLSALSSRRLFICAVPDLSVATMTAEGSGYAYINLQNTSTNVANGDYNSIDVSELSEVGTSLYLYAGCISGIANVQIAKLKLLYEDVE